MILHPIEIEVGIYKGRFCYAVADKNVVFGQRDQSHRRRLEVSLANVVEPVSEFKNG